MNALFIQCKEYACYGAIEMYYQYIRVTRATFCGNLTQFFNWT